MELWRHLKCLGFRGQEFTLDGTVLCFEYLFVLIGIYPHAILGYIWDYLRAWIWELYIRVYELVCHITRYQSGTNGQFYSQRMFAAIADCFSRPIKSAPETWIDVVEREWEGFYLHKRLVATDRTVHCLNTGSYNYLGFAGYDANITPRVVDKVLRYGVAQGASPCELGVPREQRKLEQTIARFVGKPAALAIPMGYGTNAFVLPCLVRRGDLVISDKLNHASIVVGARLSRAQIAVFKHNDMADLELKIREGIAQGYAKILVVVEGMYSMEGETCLLPEIVALKEKYRVLLYVDEAHSIGALGEHGGGVCDYYHVDPARVDVLMGTLTKSFASIGGYIAASEEVIRHIARTSPAFVFGHTFPPGCAYQARKAMELLRTPEYAARPRALRANAVRFRKALNGLGCMILGDSDSPVVPLLLHHPRKISSFSRILFSRGIATVCVGYPATPLLKARARFCLSSGHTDEDLDFAIKNIAEAVKQCGVDYFNYIPRASVGTASAASRQPPPGLAAPSDVPSSDALLPPPLAADVEHIRELRKTPPPLVEPGEYHAALPLFDDALKNVSGFDVLGISRSAALLHGVPECITKYGVGSCGPRGFYGTIQPHVDLERALERFTGMERCAVYSCELPTVMSVIPTYNAQVIVCDEAAKYGIREGVALSGCAHVYYYKHNDMRALEDVLRQVRALEREQRRAFTRKLLVTEGLFERTCQVANLPHICYLKKKYGYLLVLDETLSFGALGRTGRGLQEFWTADEQEERRRRGALLPDEVEELRRYPFIFAKDVELMVGSLERASCAVGGFCCGRLDLVELQVLFASSYCFSASAAPYTCVAAQNALGLLEDAGAQQRLRDRTQALHDAVEHLPAKYEVVGDRCSPFLYVGCRSVPGVAHEEEQRALECALKTLRGHGFLGAIYSPELEGGKPYLRLTASPATADEQFPEAIKESFA